jgi:hypothetical protein
VGRTSWTTTAWSASSSDLNSLDIDLWGCLKYTVYAAELDNVQDLQHRTRNEFEMIRTSLGIFQRLRRWQFLCARSTVKVFWLVSRRQYSVGLCS